MSEWIVQEAKQLNPVPDGAYTGPFKGVEDFKLKTGEDRWRFLWQVASGPYQGRIAPSLTDKDINPNTLAGRLIAGLLGRPLQPGENVKAAVEACVGQTYMFVVQPGPKGGKSMVRVVSKPPQM
jgi:hypothetical protein